MLWKNWILKIKPMKKIYLIALASIFSLPVFCQETLSLADFLKAVSNENLEILLDDQDAAGARSTLLLKKQLDGPAFSIGGVPLYSVSNSHALDSQYKEKEYLSHTFGAGLVLSTPTITGGSMELGVSDQLVLSGENKDFKTTHMPVMTASITQPMFVDGELFNRKEISGTRKGRDLQLRQNDLKFFYQKAEVYKAAAGEYISQIENIQKLEFLKTQLDVYSKELEGLEIQKNQGDISPTDYWEKELKVQNLKQELMDQQFIVKSGSDNLAMLINRDKAFSLQKKIPGIIVEPDISSNPELIQLRMEYESARLNESSGLSPYSPELSASLSLQPEYGLSYQAGDDPGAAFTDLFKDDSWWQFKGEVNISIPLERGNKKRQKEINLNQSSAALTNLELYEHKLNVQLKSLKGKLEYLHKKEDYLTEELKFLHQKQNEQEKLHQLERISELEVEMSQLNVLNMENTLCETRGDIFLVQLQLAVLSGRDLITLIQDFKEDI